MDYGVVSSETAEHVVLLVLLFLDGLLALGLHVLVVLCQFVVLFLVLLLLDGGKTGLLTFQLRDDGLQSLFGAGLAVVEDALYQWVVAVEHEVERVGHLSVEVHAWLEAAHLLHTTHG